MRTYIHAYIRTSVHTYIHTYKHTNICPHMSICIYPCTELNVLNPLVRFWSVVCMFRLSFVLHWLGLCTCTVPAYVHRCVRVCVCVHVTLHACAYTCPIVLFVSISLSFSPYIYIYITYVDTEYMQIYIYIERCMMYVISMSYTQARSCILIYLYLVSL